MAKIALFGAGGKMGMRLGANLKNTRFTVAPVEVSDAGKARLRDELGWQAAPLDHALQGADIVVLAVPDTAIGKVAHSIVDRLTPGSMGSCLTQLRLMRAISPSGMTSPILSPTPAIRLSLTMKPK